MNFLVCMGLVVLFAFAGHDLIKQHTKFLYIVSALLALLTAAGNLTGLSQYIPLMLWNPLVHGSLATAFFVAVMFAGALKAGSPIQKKLMSVRAEFSIIASILTLGHNAAVGREYFVKLLTDPFSLSISHLLATVCSIVMLLIMLPLFVTSFPSVRRKMDAHKWKRLQRLAYLFYGLIYIHVLLLFVPLARSGSRSAQLNLLVFSIVFLGYAVLRCEKALHFQSSFRRSVPVISAVLIALIVGISGIPQEEFSIPVRGSSSEEASAQTVSSEPASLYQDGTFEGKGKGYAGPVKVSVTIQNDKIEKIEVTEHDEDQPYWKRSLVTIDRILASQSTDVEYVAGATKSCKGIQKAVDSALKEARN